MKTAKYTIGILLLLVLVIFSGCAVEWNLIDEGVLTDINDIAGRMALTFDDERVVLLNYNYSLEEPATLVLGEYYYLYKEAGDAVWNGYHLVDAKR